MNEKFIEIFNLYKNDIFRLAFSYTNSIYDAEDVTQNVFVKLYKKDAILILNKVEIKKWLVKVTINECKSLFLSSWKKKTRNFTQNEEENIIQKVNNNELLSSVMNLDKKYRIVTYLYYYEDYKVKEIAKLLNILETNVQTRLSRARDQLKMIIKEES